GKYDAMGYAWLTDLQRREAGEPSFQREIHWPRRTLGEAAHLDDARTRTGEDDAGALPVALPLGQHRECTAVSRQLHEDVQTLALRDRKALACDRPHGIAIHGGNGTLKGAEVDPEGGGRSAVNQPQAHTRGPFRTHHQRIAERTIVGEIRVV